MKRLAVALVVLQGLDLGSTWLALGAGAVEGHPIGRAVMGTGWLELAVFKAAATAIFLLLVGWAYRRGGSDQTAALAVLAGVVVLMLAVVGWNSAAVLRLS